MKKKVVFNPQELFLIKKAVLCARREKVELFLVGGILRDKLLGRERRNPDIDFCLKKNAIAFGRKLARALQAGFVVLDQEHGACRLIYTHEQQAYTLDLTDFRGRSLEEDLCLRDFTVNSIALKAGDVSGPGDVARALIDPQQGRRDLARKILRCAGKRSFSDDPLRILRAFSFSCLLGFKIDQKTLCLAVAARKGLAQVSTERIRDELFKILESPDAFGALVFMDERKILEVVIPEINVMRGIYQGPYHHLDIWKHTLESVRQFDKILKSLRDKKARVYMDTNMGGGRSRRALVKLALLLHDIGKPATRRYKKGKISFYGHERAGLRFAEAICRRLKLSNEEVRSVKTMVLWHLRPGYLGDLDEVSLRARFRYFRDTGTEAPAVALLSMADQRATRGPLTTAASVRRHEKTALSLIREYFRAGKEKKQPRLVNGNDVMRATGLVPSPLVGEILKELDELQAIGKLKNRSQALASARRLARKHNQKTSSK